jgi:MFS family permease
LLHAPRVGFLSRLPTFVSLHHRDYRYLWIGSTVTGMAIWAMIVARGWLVFNLSDSSSLMVGVVTFAAMIPLIFATPVGGLLADRFDRRKLIAFGYAINLVQAILLTILVVFDAVQIWHVIALAFVSGLVRAMIMPSLQALVPNLVPREDLLNAVALSGVAMHGSRAGGPGLAALLLATVGVGGAFVLGGIFYAVGIVYVLKVRTVSRGEVRSEEGIVRNLTEGLVYAYRHATIGLIILLVAVHCSLTMSFESMLPVFAQKELGSGGSVFSVLIMATGGGALVGVLGLASLRSSRGTGWLLLITGIISGLTPLALAASSTLPIALLAASGMGASQATFMAITNTLVQSGVEDRVRGRVSSIYAMHAGGTMAFANLTYGYLADQWGTPIIFTITGSMFIAFQFLLSLSNSTLRHVYRTGYVAPA